MTVITVNCVCPHDIAFLLASRAGGAAPVPCVANSAQIYKEEAVALRGVWIPILARYIGAYRTSPTSLCRLGPYAMTPVTA